MPTLLISGPEEFFLISADGIPLSYDFYLCNVQAFLILTTLQMDNNIFRNNRRLKLLVLNTLQHYTAFRLPLKATEIYRNLPGDYGFTELLVLLEDLAEGGDIYRYNGYYSKDREVEQLVLQRVVSRN